MSSITYDNIVYINNDLVVDTNTLYVDSSNNRVGINTVPSYEFDVSGNVKLTSIIDRLGLTGNNGQVLSSTGIEVEWKDVSGSGGSGTNYWDLSGSNLYNNSGTNVGINTNNPVYEVDISGETRIQTTNVRIGRNAGDINQGIGAIAIGENAARNSQGSYAIAIGSFAGNTQGNSAIAIGLQSGNILQRADTIAIGFQAAFNGQQSSGIAIGRQAGYTSQKIGAIAIGNIAGQSNQTNNAVAIGVSAGRILQGSSAVAIGFGAGTTGQGTNAVAIGNLAGLGIQGVDAIAIGDNAGQTNQNTGAIAIGSQAGQGTQGTNAIAIGNLAGRTNQTANSIIINATGLDLSSMDVSGLFIAPVRRVDGITQALYYNTSTSEIVYSDISSSGGGTNYWTLTGNNIYNNNSENVGIGISTPTYNLDVSGSSRISNRLYVSNSIHLGNTSNISIFQDSSANIDTMVSSSNSSVIDIFHTAYPYGDVSNAIVDISFANWGSNNVTTIVDIMSGSRSFNTSQGHGIVSGRLYAMNTSAGSTFDSFNEISLTTKDISFSYTSPSNYGLRLSFKPTNEADIISGAIRVINLTGISPIEAIHGRLFNSTGSSPTVEIEI
jgi:hypothetical protein